MALPVTLIEPDLAAWVELLPACQAAGAKVYPFAAVPQKTVSWPFVTYHRVFNNRVRGLKGPVGVSRPLLQWDVFGRTYGEAETLAAAIREAFEGLSGTLLNGRLIQVAIPQDEGGAREDGDYETNPPHGDETTQFRATFPLRIWFKEEA